MSHSPVEISGYDPEHAIRAQQTLTAAGIEAEVVPSLREIGARVAEDDSPRVVILTGGLHETATGDLLERIREGPGATVVLALISESERARFDPRSEIGVDEVLTKPFDPNELTLVIRQLLLRGELTTKTRIIGRSPSIQLVLDRVAQYAPVHSTVLIEGESGTGKELIARAIHDLSPRSGHPFIAVNCAALTESLLESELFGHEKGAFTGATSLRKGRFELAHEGTLLLDEVGEMPLSTQVKFLRVLEEQEFMRVGGAAPIHVDVRVVAATNRSLEDAVEAGEFRRDLFYRLNVLNIRMPALRERREDIPLLIQHFVQEFCRENDRHFVGITDDAMSILQNYDWPGNVRELRNLVESMLVLTPGSKIRAQDIPEEIYSRASPDRLLPMLIEGDAEETTGGRRLEALLGYLYQDLKRELDALHRDNVEIRTLLKSAERSVDWVDAVEVEARPDPDVSTPVGPGLREVSAEVPSARIPIGISLDELERIAIEQTLESVGGNRRRAAEMLEIGERTLYRKIKKYGL